jgi:HK97 family phage major capsid protein
MHCLMEMAQLSQQVSLRADADVTTADNSTISFDEIISLYFSLKDEYRNNAVFIMHDNTAMLLRTLKDTSG